MIVLDGYYDTTTTSAYYETADTTESNYDYFYVGGGSANKEKRAKILVKEKPVYKYYEESAMDKGCCREKVKNCCLPIPDN